MLQDTNIKAKGERTKAKVKSMEHGARFPSLEGAGVDKEISSNGILGLYNIEVSDNVYH